MKQEKKLNKGTFWFFVIVTTIAIIAVAITVFITIRNYIAINTVPSIYRTESEWHERFKVEKYVPNQEITDSDYDRDLAAKTENGTFVGYNQDDVKVWKGMPFAKQPVGDLRFKQAEAPEASDKTYEAYHYGKTCVQTPDENERASQYEQGEDCLNLNVWSSTRNQDDKKPVLVWIHGGGWVSGGTVDPLYDGWNLAHYNPDVILVSITYRTGMMGMINLSSFPDGGEYSTSAENGLFDQIQALKWIKNNIAAFGGDPANVTIAGESAGGVAVSLLAVMPEAKGLFNKAVPMSGSSNLTMTSSQTQGLPNAMKEEFGVQTVKDLQAVPIAKLDEWWRANEGAYAQHPTRDGATFNEDVMERWKRGDTKDLLVLQGHTSNEFGYYQSVFLNVYDIYLGMCEALRDYANDHGNDEFKAAYQDYVNALKEYGYSETDIIKQYANDTVLAAGNLYQAEMHAKNGGTGYFYIFDKSYDGSFKYIGAGHAVDCSYLFGNFDGDEASGTNQEVELSREFQRMITNFVTTGNPSTTLHDWPKYDNQNRTNMIISDNIHTVNNPESRRTDAILRMMESNEAFKHAPRLNMVADRIAEKYPHAFLELENKIQRMQQKLHRK